MNLNKITNYLFLSLFTLSFYSHLQGLDMYFLAAVAKHNLDDIKLYHKHGANINAINNFSAEDWDNFAKNTNYISSEQAAFLASPLRQGWSALIMINYSNDTDSIQNAISIVKYLISKGANVNYEFILNHNTPTFVSVFSIQTIRATAKGNLSIPVILLKSGVKLSEEDIKSLEDASKIDDEPAKIAYEILKFYERLKLRKKKIIIKRNKNLRIEILRETNVFPEHIVDITGEYIEGEEENK